MERLVKRKLKIQILAVPVQVILAMMIKRKIKLEEKMQNQLEKMVSP
jgi:hypothetical protein